MDSDFGTHNPSHQPDEPGSGPQPAQPFVSPVATPPAPASPFQPAHAFQPPQPPVPASAPASSAPFNQRDQPQAVVRVLSVRGLEYLMMTIALFVAAFSLGGIILSLINGGTSFDVLAFPVSSLLVAVGLFSFFFLRLKKAELQDPALRYDPSKRRLSQATQVVSYLVSFGALIGFIYSILAKIAGSFSGQLWKTLLDLVVVLAIAGGILAYYWVDEHKVR